MRSGDSPQPSHVQRSSATVVCGSSASSVVVPVDGPRAPRRLSRRGSCQKASAAKHSQNQNDERGADGSVVTHTTSPSSLRVAGANASPREPRRETGRSRAVWLGAGQPRQHISAGPRRWYLQVRRGNPDDRARTAQPPVTSAWRTSAPAPAPAPAGSRGRDRCACPASRRERTACAWSRPCGRP